MIFFVAKDLTQFLLYNALWLCAWFAIWGMRQSYIRRELSNAATVAWANMVSAWVNDDREGRNPILSLQDLTPYVGEIVPPAKPVEDELGAWFPDRHREVSPVLFEACTFVFPVEQGVGWAPWWRTPTGAWETVAPRQLEASPS